MEIFILIISAVLLFVSYKLGKADGYMLGRSDGYYFGYIKSKVSDGNWPAEHEYYKNLYSVLPINDDFREANRVFEHTVPENSKIEVKKHQEYVDKYCNSFISKNFNRNISWNIISNR